jgi:thiol:disulfide interchange protein DsbD
MEHTTFRDPGVQRLMNQAVLLRADVTANDAADQALMQRFGIFGPPSIILFNRQGMELRSLRVVGYMDAEEFSAQLEKAFNVNPS